MLEPFLSVWPSVDVRKTGDVIELQSARARRLLYLEDDTYRRNRPGRSNPIGAAFVSFRHAAVAQPGNDLNGNLLSEELEHSPAPEASTPRTTHVGDANPRHGFKLTIHLVYQRQAAP